MKSAFCVLGLFFANAALAVSPVNSTLFGNLAIKGYDPVAYFTDAKPAKGDKAISFEWNGARWQFATAQHRDAFAKEPEKYAPQFGGYCAWAVAQGDTANIDPDAWKIVDGKLYLNYDADIQAKWSQDIPGNIGKADKNWPEILKK